MPDDQTTPAVEQEAPAAPVVTPVEPTPATPEPTPAPTMTAEQYEAALAAERAKTAAAVAAEKTARQKRQELETQLGTMTAAEQAREAERVANLSLAERLAEETRKREAAELAAQNVQSQWQDFRVETELSTAGFLTGLEGDAKVAQLQTLKALTGLELVKEDGQFSISKFAEKFGGLKPAAPIVPAPVEDPVPPVVDLGGKTPPPAEQQVTRKTELLKQLEVATNRGQRAQVIAINRELSAL